LLVIECTFGKIILLLGLGRRRTLFFAHGTLRLVFGLATLSLKEIGLFFFLALFFLLWFLSASDKSSWFLVKSINDDLTFSLPFRLFQRGQREKPIQQRKYQARQ